MAAARAGQRALVETIGKHRDDEPTTELLDEIKYFWRGTHPLIGLTDDCETAVYYDRITCELKFIPLTTDTVASASNTTKKWIGQPGSVRQYAAAKEDWDWFNPNLRE